MKKELRNISGTFLIDATAAFLNGAGLAPGEDKTTVLPKIFYEQIGSVNKPVPYVSAQAWRRWLRNTSNEENDWPPSELTPIGFSSKGNINKIATELNPIDYPEDDIFGYMRAGGSNYKITESTFEQVKKDGLSEEKINELMNTEDQEFQDETEFLDFIGDTIGYDFVDKYKKKILKSSKNRAESVQRTTALKTSILKGIQGKRVINTDEAYVHLKEGSLPYSTKFYSSYLEAFFLLEYYRLGVYDNLGSRVELASEILETHRPQLMETTLDKKFKRYTLVDAKKIRKQRAAGLLKAIAHLRGGAKQAAFSTDVSPKVLILAGLTSANPIFNDVFEANEVKSHIKLETLIQIVSDYQDKIVTPVYIGLRNGFLANEADIKNRLGGNDKYYIDSPIGIVNHFIFNYLKVE